MSSKKKKVSAGGVVLRKGKRNTPLTMLIQQANHKGWGFPKGHIDPGETLRETALREVEEETGVIGEIIEELEPTYYEFTNGKGTLIQKTVHWYIMRYVGQGKQTHAHEILNMEWLSLKDARKKCTFDSDRELCDRVMAHIEELTLN